MPCQEKLMNRARKWLMIAPLLAGAVAMADEGRGGHGGNGRQDRPDVTQFGDADRSGRGNGAYAHNDGRQENHAGNRGDNRRDNRNTAPPRVWASPPRWNAAPDRDHGDDGRRDNNRGYADQNHRFDGYRGEGRHDDRADWRRDFNRDRYAYNRYPERRYSYYQDYGRSYGRPAYQGHRWRRGESLPYGYYDRSRWEPDYWRYDLYDPRDGCGWVRSDTDALLVVLATGLVLDAVYDIYR
jgi:Ni/Co efflux regulator RcnB